MDFNSLVQTLLSLGGFAGLVTVLVNILKTTGVVKDGQAPVWSTGFNLVGLIALYLIQAFGDASIVPALDSAAGSIAQILLLVFGLVWQLLASRLSHNALKGVPLVGMSFELAKQTALKAK